MAGQLHRFSNQAVTYLGSAISSTDTEIVVVNILKFPHPPFEVTCGQEVMRVTAVDDQTNTLTVVRGREGTTAVLHAAGDPIAHTVTRDGLLDVLDNNGIANAALSFSATDTEAPGSGTVYLAPLQGNNISLWDTLENRWRKFTLDIAPNVSANEVAGKCVDVFAYWNEATQAVALQKVVWDRDTGRPSGYDLVRVDGVMVSQHSTAWRHVGTYQMLANSAVALSSHTPSLSGTSTLELPRYGKNILRVDPPINGYEIHGVEPIADGDTVYLLNISETDTFYLKHTSVTAPSGSKLLVLDLDDYPVFPLGGVTLVYDATSSGYRVLGACCTTTTTTTTTTTSTTTSTTTTSGPTTTTTSTTTSTTTTTASPYPLPATCLKSLTYVRSSSNTNGISGNHFEFSDDGTNWYVVSSVLPKSVANSTYTFRLQNTSTHPFRLFDTDGFNRLVPSATNPASGNVADGFWSGDVVLTVTLEEKAPFSYDCSLHGYESGIGEDAIIYDPVCTYCAQPDMFIRLNMDPDTLPPPPAWPSNVPEVQMQFTNPPGEATGGDVYRTSLQFSGMSGVIAGLKITLHDVSSFSSSGTSVLMLKAPSGKDVLLAGALANNGNITEQTYVFTNDSGDSLFSFGSGGNFRPNPNGNQNVTYWPDSSAPFGTTLTDLFGDSPNGEWKLGMIADTGSGSRILRVPSWSVEILTSTNESHTVRATDPQSGGYTPVNAWPYEADTELQDLEELGGVNYFTSTVDAGETRYYRFRSKYSANYYLWAGGQNSGGVKLEIFRNWNASGSPSVTYTNLYDSSQKRLACDAGEFIVFKFTNTSIVFKYITLKLQTPGVHYEMSANETDWYLPERWKFGGANPTGPATYNLNLKYLKNSKFAMKMTGAFSPVWSGGSGIGTVSSNSVNYYYFDSTKAATQELSFTMGGTSPLIRYITTITGTLVIQNDDLDDNRQSIIYGAGCFGDDPVPDTTSPPTTTLAPWVAGYYCVNDSYQGTTGCSYISTRPPANPLVTYTGPYVSSGACNVACASLGTTTTTTAAPTTTSAPSYYLCEEYRSPISDDRHYTCRETAGPAYILLNGYQYTKNGVVTVEDCGNCPPTTTTTTTTTAAPTTTTTTTGSATTTTTAAPATTTTTSTTTSTSTTSTTAAPSYRYNCEVVATTGNSFIYGCVSTGSYTVGTYASEQDCLNAGCGSGGGGGGVTSTSPPG